MYIPFAGDKERLVDVADALTTDELRKQVEAVPYWWHSLDLGNGVVTPGRKSVGRLKEELELCRLPDLRGKTVLDIGAWDGYFSFEAERLGARRVVALDHYVWSIDFSKVPAPARPGERPKPVRLAEQVPGMWRPLELPGKRGFDIAHKALSSNVEATVADFMEIDLESLGQFDVVLYLGILYHMRHPLLALERVARATRELAVIETEAISLPLFKERAFCEFFETDELAGDPSNWWSPNAKALVGMCRAAGFRRVDVLCSVPSKTYPSLFAACKRLFRLDSRSDAGIRRYRLMVHAYK